MRLRDAFLLVLSGACLAAGLAGEVLGWPGRMVDALFLAAILAGAVEIVPAGLRGVFQERALDINFLVTIAVAGAIGLGQWSEAATVVFLFTLGESLERYTLARTRRSIQALMAMAPETAQLKTAGGAERTVPVEAVPPGSTVAVRPGDRIPLDGVVVTGESTVDQAPITGESAPVDKLPGDTVYAGTINRTGYLEIRTTKPFAENTLARIIHLVESAQSEKAPSQRFVERFARVYTPAVVLAAVLVVIIPPLAFDQPLIPWFNRALVLLLVACPCALVISTPVSVVAAIGNASRHGVLIKGGAYLERAGTLRAVAFDKTGTLTRGVPEVQRVIPVDGLSSTDVLRVAAAVESRSEHPLAAAIVRAARREGLRSLPPVERFRAAAGSGVAATVGDDDDLAGIEGINGATVVIGRPHWLETHGVPIDALRPILDDLASHGQTPVLVARVPAALLNTPPPALQSVAGSAGAPSLRSGQALARPASPTGRADEWASPGEPVPGALPARHSHSATPGWKHLAAGDAVPAPATQALQRAEPIGAIGISSDSTTPEPEPKDLQRAEPIGVIAIADEIRPSAAPTVAALRRIGVRRVVLLTGDNAATAHAIARQAGIAPEDVFADLLPEQKVDVIRRLVHEHHHVAMVGDGVNDAPALAAATVGIAMGAGGSDAALETADVALVADDLTRLPWVLALSRRAAWTIRANVAFALVTKFAVLGLAAAGMANLWLAIAADTGASIVVILNGMRLLGRLPLPPAADPARLRQRYGLEPEEEHDHAGHAGHGH